MDQCIPGDFVKKVEQILNDQSDLILMSSFAGPSYLTIRSSVYVILIRDPCISVFTIHAKLDPITYSENLSNTYSISMNKQ